MQVRPKKVTVWKERSKIRWRNGKKNRKEKSKKVGALVKKEGGGKRERKQTTKCKMRMRNT